jgi:multidrug efflux pump
MEKENKLKTKKVSKLVWMLGIPMIISMVLQALYNIVDTAFVINMGEEIGVKANLALTYVFPIQILMIAVGVGTGVGINALLSKSLGKGDKEGIKKTVGNGIFLGLVIYILFLLFGLFGAKPFIAMQCGNENEVLEMGTSYLQIVCCLSFGSIGYTIYERFLQATGKTVHSMISQITGALTNIVLDYVFIYICNFGIAGAAYATIIGQVLSLLVAMFFHYFCNKELENSIKSIIPNLKTIKEIYFIGGSAAIMQALLSFMMFGMNMILGTSSFNPLLLQGVFGIYYKIQQIPLFASFGLTNALITLTSYTKELNDNNRLKEVYKYGLIASIIVPLVIAGLFEIFAEPIATLFGLASGNSSTEIVDTCVYAIRIASISYVFMGITVGIQGILQGLRSSLKPLILSALRLIILTLPIAWLFTLSADVSKLVWITFIISEFLTSIIAILISFPNMKVNVNNSLEISLNRSSN